VRSGWFVVMALLAGCTEWRGWTDMPTATVTPAGPAEWQTVVAGGIQLWNDALSARGCPTPFTIGPGGHRIELVPAERWEYDTAAGYTDESAIEVREKDGSVRDDGTVVHELGHALGLDHASIDYGPSVMIGKGHETRVVLDRDASAAACALGCGPCAADADPYAL